MRARLVAAGLSPGRVAVIRGAVDFAQINQTRRSDVRQRLVGSAGPVALMHGPPTRAGGQFFGLWAAAIVSQVRPDLRVILPYASQESRRLRRFVRAIGMPDLLVVPDPDETWPHLLGAADVFVCPAVGEINTEPLAWAMAAGVPIVGSAVRSVAELIADRHNGLLSKPAVPRLLAGRWLAAIEDGDLVRRITDVARGQAFEVFGLRNFCDHYARLYENLLAGRDVGDGIRDTAMVA
jgi:glycosyltransferase involved in cell wall biosynthesis